MRGYLQVIGAVTITAVAVSAFDSVMQTPYQIEQTSQGVYGIRDLDGEFYPRGDAENLLRFMQDLDPVELRKSYQKILEEER